MADASPSWRLEPIDGSDRAWFYVITHAQPWERYAEVLEHSGFMLEGTRESVLHEELGACLRYLVVPDDGARMLLDLGPN